MTINNSTVGTTLQKCICDKYRIKVSEFTSKCFNGNYDKNYKKVCSKAIEKIFGKLGCKPIECCTFEKRHVAYNFVLDKKNEKGDNLTLKVTTAEEKAPVAVVGQGGLGIFNAFFQNIVGRKVSNRDDVKAVFNEHIHKMLPIYFDYLFSPDFIVWLPELKRKRPNYRIFQRKFNSAKDLEFKKEKCEITVNRKKYKISELGSINWNKSTELYYDGCRIANFQLNDGKSVNFRFYLSSLDDFIRNYVTKKCNTETFGISAEYAICKSEAAKSGARNISIPKDLVDRADSQMVSDLDPIIKEIFDKDYLPKVVEYTGNKSDPRRDGGKGKCPYDFRLEGNKTLSLKTNKNYKRCFVCPSDIGQPGVARCKEWLCSFGEEFKNIEDDQVRRAFKECVLKNIKEMLKQYTAELFYSDYLLWICKTKTGHCAKILPKYSSTVIDWDEKEISLSKKKDDWNVSNTVYDISISKDCDKKITIGNFEVHESRNTFVFRFHMLNLISLFSQADKDRIIEL